jgi:hypothetical protein
VPRSKSKAGAPLIETRGQLGGGGLYMQLGRDCGGTGCGGLRAAFHGGNSGQDGGFHGGDVWVGGDSF